MEIKIQIPDSLGRELQPFQDRLPEILERGLQELLAETSVEFQDENLIMELLTSQPLPQQVLGIQPSTDLQTRISELLDRNKKDELSAREENELERYLMLEHLVLQRNVRVFTTRYSGSKFSEPTRYSLKITNIAL